MTRLSKNFLCILGIIWLGMISAMAQDMLPLNWHLLDPARDGLPGISLDHAYAALQRADKKAKTTIVAILDSGVDFNHEDLKPVMWVNPGEIPDNGKDDDGNGYIDDVHGWNFIGGANGNVQYDTYEATRLYASMRYKFETANASKLSGDQKKEYEFYLKLKKDVEDRRESAQKNLDQIQQTEKIINEAIQALGQAMGSMELNEENLQKIEEGDSQNLAMGLAIAKQVIQGDVKFPSVKEFRELIMMDFQEGINHYSKEVNYAFNPDYDSRSIVGDDHSKLEERNYGNNDVMGPESSHGTHVAGIVAAMRNNGLGMDGIADQVRIMSVRCVPDGDERDKDVANAIRYAVDNGASVINMSFGKGYSPNKKGVDEAVKYARDHDVLLVHAAGNSATNNDQVDNFPNRSYQKKKFLSCNKADHWIEVGASSFEAGAELIAPFSNFGKKDVDLFAPGVQIYSTKPGHGYVHEQGTSMASPVVAGVAALIRSYFPDLTAKQVKKILLKSVQKPTYKVIHPESKKEVSMKSLCATGGMIDANKAVQLALKTKAKKKKGKDERMESSPVKSNDSTRS